jgi:hypothetical protein
VHPDSGTAARVKQNARRVPSKRSMYSVRAVIFTLVSIGVLGIRAKATARPTATSIVSISTLRPLRDHTSSGLGPFLEPMRFLERMVGLRLRVNPDTMSVAPTRRPAPPRLRVWT